MRVLFIGGTRFIGAHAAHALHDQGADVTVYHRGRSENPLISNVRHIRDASAEYPILRFPAAVTKTDWDIVVHMVAMGDTDMRAAVDALRGRVGRMVLISSADVYRAYGRLIGIEIGPPDPVPLDEESPVRSRMYPYRGQEEKIGAYARDYEKLLAERAVKTMANSAWTVLRLPKVYGPEDNADLATVYGFASQPDWRWTHGHVDNVAAAIGLAAIHPAASGRVFNVGEDTTPTMGERLARLPKRSGDVPTPPPMHYEQLMVCDTSRIRRELGYKEVVPEPDAMLAVASRLPGHLGI